MSTSCLSPVAPDVHPRATAAGPRPGRTGAGVTYVVLCCLASVLLIAAGAAAWSEVTGPRQPAVVGLDETMSMAGLDVVVSRFERRADAVAGVNAKKQPMSGPAMPMNAPLTGGEPQASGTTDKPDMPGMSGMSGMSGMAGALKEGEERIDIDISLQNSSDETLPSLDPSRLELMSDGRPVPLLQPTKSDVTVTPLSAGHAMAGTVNFIIPQGTTPLELRYRGQASIVVLETATDPSEHGAGPQDGPAKH